MRMRVEGVITCLVSLCLVSRCCCSRQGTVIATAGLAPIARVGLPCLAEELAGGRSTPVCRCNVVEARKRGQKEGEEMHPTVELWRPALQTGLLWFVLVCSVYCSFSFLLLLLLLLSSLVFSSFPTQIPYLSRLS